MRPPSRRRSATTVESVTRDAIATERLELVSLSAEFLTALLADERSDAERIAALTLPDGWPDRHDAGFLHYRLQQMRDDPSAQEWLVRALILREEGRPMVGHAGFHGPPGVNALRRPDAVELGYSVLESHRRRGYATESVRGLIRWASEERGIRRFIGSVSPGNAPSLAILARLGFTEIGRHWDEEDGEELEFELVLP